MKKNIFKTFSLVFIITLISKVLGFIREIMIASLFGTGIEATAFSTALKIPTQIVDIVLSSAIISTFIPVFSEIMEKEGDKVANKFASNFINFTAFVGTLIVVIGIIFAKPIVSFLAGGLNAETFSLTVELIRLTFPMIIFTAMAFSLVGFLQFNGEFNIPAAISGISNLIVIVFLFITKNNPNVNYLSIIMVVAWFMQFLIQVPFAKKFGLKFSSVINFSDKNLKKFFKLAIPIIISSAVLPINNLVTTKIASSLGDGKLVSLDYAYRLYLVISGVFTYAIGNIIFPELSRSITSNKKDDFRQIISKAIKLLMFILIPLMIGIIIFNKEIISILYERGNFDNKSTILTALPLLYYSIGIIGAGVVEVMNKSFYSKQDTKTPLLVGITIVILNALICYGLSKTSLNYAGLALGTSITAILNGIILFTIMAIKEKGLANEKLIVYVLKVVISGFLMGILVVLINNSLIESGFKGSKQVDLIRSIIGGAVGVISYLAITWLFKVNEIKTLLKK